MEGGAGLVANVFNNVIKSYPGAMHEFWCE